MEDNISWIFNPKARLLNDRKRWLDILEMMYNNWKRTKDPQYTQMMKFCGEQSKEIKQQLAKLK